MSLPVSDKIRGWGDLGRQSIEKFQKLLEVAELQPVNNLEEVRPQLKAIEEVHAMFTQVAHGQALLPEQQVRLEEIDTSKIIHGLQIQLKLHQVEALHEQVLAQGIDVGKFNEARHDLSNLLTPIVMSVEGLAAEIKKDPLVQPKSGAWLITRASQPDIDGSDLPPKSR